MTTDTLALMQQLMTGQETGETDVASLLAQSDDPTVRLVAQMWAQQSRQREVEEEEPEAHETVKEDPAARLEFARNERRRRRKMRALIEELEFTREIVDTLAAALGACYLCWGHDEHCEQCRGRGVPGWGEPEPELFGEFVAPALKRIQKRPISDNRPASPGVAAPDAHFRDERT